MALQTAHNIMSGSEEPRTVLRVIVENMLYPVTIDVLKQVSVVLIQYNTIQYNIMSGSEEPLTVLCVIALSCCHRRTQTG